MASSWRFKQLGYYRAFLSISLLLCYTPLQVMFLSELTASCMFSVKWWGASGMPALVVLEWRTVQLAISVQWYFLGGFVCFLLRS